MLFLIDTWAWVEYFRGSDKGAKIKDSIERGGNATSIICLAELVDKFQQEGIKNWKKKVDFIFTKTQVMDLTADIAVRAGENKQVYRKVTKSKLGLADAIIYETARAHNIKVLTGDPHFKGLDNVVLI